jgi:O-antigen ligase
VSKSGSKKISQSAGIGHLLSAHVFGLILSLPFLIPVHNLPITSFHSEILAVILGICGIGIFFGYAKNEMQLRAPMVLLIPSLLLGVVILQWMLGYFSYTSNALMYGAGLVWCGLMMWMGANLFFEQNKASQIAAWYLLIASCFNAVIGLLQFLQWGAGFESLMVPSSALENQGVFGNLAQQNHFSTYIAIGLISLWFLQIEKKVHLRISLFAAALLLSALFLSRSRSAYVYVVLILFVGAYTIAKQRLTFELKNKKRFFLISALVLALVGFLLILFANSSPQIQRLFYLSEALGSRIYLWRNAWEMFLKAPLLGIGFDQFAFVLFQQISEFKQTQQWGLDQYAHNLFLQLLAVAGVVGLLSLLLPLLAFVKSQWRQPLQSQRVFFILILLVLLIHSLLEQPLYYMYFLGLAALSMGALDVPCLKLKMHSLVRFSSVFVSGALLILSGVTWQNYALMEQHFFPQSPQQELSPAQLMVKQNVYYELHQTWMLKPYMESLNPAAHVPVEANAVEKLELNSRLLRFAPLPETAFRHVALLAQTQNIELAKRAFEQASMAFPLQADMYQNRFQLLAQDEPELYAHLYAHAVDFLKNKK